VIKIFSCKKLSFDCNVILTDPNDMIRPESVTLLKTKAVKFSDAS